MLNSLISKNNSNVIGICGDFDSQGRKVSLLRIETIHITFALLQFMFGLEVFKGDRKEDTGHKRKILKQIRKGTIKPFEWSIAFQKGCLIGCSFIRVDGQHSSRVLYENWEEIKHLIENNPNALAIIKIWQYEDNTALADLFSIFDPQLSVRTKPQINQMVKGGHPDKDINSIGDSIMNSIVSGLTYYKGWGADYTSKEKADLIYENEEFCILADRIIRESPTDRSTGQTRYLTRNQGFIRAMREIYAIDKQSAIDFLNNFVKLTPLDLNSDQYVSPVVALREKLVQVIVKKELGKKMLNGNQTQPVLQVLHYVVLAFNMWQETKYILRKQFRIDSSIEEKDGNNKGFYAPLSITPVKCQNSIRRERKREEEYKKYYAKCF